MSHSFFRRVDEQNVLRWVRRITSLDERFGTSQSPKPTLQCSNCDPRQLNLSGIGAIWVN